MRTSSGGWCPDRYLRGERCGCGTVEHDLVEDVRGDGFCAGGDGDLAGAVEQASEGADAAVGAAGLVEWPVLLAVGGTALVLHEWDRKSGRPDRQVKAVGRTSKPEQVKKESSGNSHKAAGRSQDRTHSSSHTRSTH